MLGIIDMQLRQVFSERKNEASIIMLGILDSSHLYLTFHYMPKDSRDNDGFALYNLLKKHTNTMSFRGNQEIRENKKLTLTTMRRTRR